MPTLSQSYLGSGKMPAGVSQALQNRIKSAVVFGTDAITKGEGLFDIGYSNYQNDIENFLAQQITGKVKSWTSDPTTTKADLEGGDV